MRTPAKLLSLLTGGLWLAVALSSVVAQEDAAPAPNPPAAPEPAATEPAPYPLEIPNLPPPSNNGALFPEGSRLNPPATTNASKRGGRRNSTTTGTRQKGRSRDRTLQSADSAPLAVRTAYRRDKTAALARDPELLDLLRRADDARTDEQKRVLLHEYYTRLFATIRRLDSSADMKAHLALLVQVAEQRYDPKRRAVAGEEELLNTRESAGRERLGR